MPGLLGWRGVRGSDCEGEGEMVRDFVEPISLMKKGDEDEESDGDYNG